jgi:hypothetical protein
LWRAIQSVLQQIPMYPLAEYDGTMKRLDWSRIKELPPAAASGKSERQWVFPEKFFDELPAFLADAPPLPGEEARYGQMRAVLEAIKANPTLKPVLISTVAEADDQLVKPLYWLGTKNKTLKLNPDGSLTLYVQADPPPEAQHDNWLPSPRGGDFSLYVRAYWPKAAVMDGTWTPPLVQRAG